MLLILPLFLLHSAVATEASPIPEEELMTTFSFQGKRFRIWSLQPSNESTDYSISDPIFFYEPVVVPCLNKIDKYFSRPYPDISSDGHIIKLVIDTNNGQVRDLAYTAVNQMEIDVKKENVRPLPILNLKLKLLVEDLPTSYDKSGLTKVFNNPGSSVEVLLTTGSEEQAKHVSELLENGHIAYSMDVNQTTMIMNKSGKLKDIGLLKGKISLREFKLMHQVHVQSQQIQEQLQKEEQMKKEINDLRNNKDHQAQVTNKYEQIVKLKEELKNITEKCPNPDWTRMCFLDSCSCYRVFTGTQPWVKALRSCRKSGAELASVHSTEENIFLAELCVANVGMWIGLSDLSEEGSYQWSDGTPLDYTLWNQGEPSDRNMTEDCVEMRLGVSKEWNDLSCSRELRYVCKQNNDPSKKTVEDQKQIKKIRDSILQLEAELNNRTERCQGPSWTHKCFLDSCFCYRIFTKSNSWERASQVCQNYDAELASIHSNEENDFITKLIVTTASARTWIGLHDISKEGLYQWSDGSTLEFIKWADREPNDKKGAENCIEMIAGPGVVDETGSWNDLRCFWERQYICKQRSLE